MPTLAEYPGKIETQIDDKVALLSPELSFRVSMLPSSAAQSLPAGSILHAAETAPRAGRIWEVGGLWSDLISHKVFRTSFCKSQFPHKSVNLFFILVIVMDKLTDLWGS